jgi:hypothetical protein
MMENIPWLKPRPYIQQRIDLRELAPVPPPAFAALFTAPIRDSGDAPCAACGQASMWRTRRKVTASIDPDAEDYAFLMLCDDVASCVAAFLVAP